ncbi:C-C motif chemokine 24 [Mastomys coucha]|uniref:C-C motif chemokine 24 n=1 Tax=Mastomys coucha TaxID=35658 RepID=UPI0012627365|nr:C-C motif chemokine 24 [Mastomys coucha]XP_031194081.1 C-C motif chemokine 24 [Mastomys coucha]XP_031194082.1 C-C motif chemokine 24 [Mastomys coucha]XP_031194083.1 C-C motif chemokine 24 [Mastomys coucha]
MAGSTMIVAGLLLVACACCIFPTDSVTVPSSCCMSFISKKIPENRVVSYQLANGSICPKAGVIFITKKGHKTCTDPKLPWVQRYIRNLDAKKNQPSEGAKAVGTKFAVQRRRGNSTKV